MHLTTCRSVALVAGLAVVGLLAGCGGDDATASSTSPLSSEVAAQSGGPAGQVGGEGTPPPVVNNPAAPAPPETPQAAPSGGAGAAVPQGPKEKEFLAALKQAGVNPSGNGESAVSAANYICNGIKQGAKEDELTPIVNAVAGVEGNLTGSKMSPEQAGKIYLDVAKKTYCQ